jgi:hypothetical protein
LAAAALGSGVRAGAGDPGDEIEGPADAMLVPAPAAYLVPDTPVAPEVGTVNIPEYNFPEQFSEFSFHTSLTKHEVIAATVKIVNECNKVLKSAMFNTYFAKSQRLEDFEQSQKQATAQVVATIKEQWVNSVKGAILKSFKNVGKVGPRCRLSIIGYPVHTRRLGA